MGRYWKCGCAGPAGVQPEHMPRCPVCGRMQGGEEPENIGEAIEAAWNDHVAALEHLSHVQGSGTVEEKRREQRSNETYHRWYGLVYPEKTWCNSTGRRLDMDKALDWKRDSNGTLCASCGMFHLLVWNRLPDRQRAGGFVFRVINAIGDYYEGVRQEESLAIADAHHAAELLSGGVL